MILCIIKLFRDNLELLGRTNGKLISTGFDLISSYLLITEHLTSIRKSTYLFVQQLIASKLLDLDNDEYEKIPHRYRTRVDADAAALELLCLSCDDEIGKRVVLDMKAISSFPLDTLNGFFLHISINQHIFLFLITLRLSETR